MDDVKDWYGSEMATFGDRVAAAREHAGLDQKGLAKRLGIRVSTLRAWENDLNEPRANRLSMLAGVLNVSMMWLINGEGEGVGAPSDTTLGATSREILTELRTLRADLKAKNDQLGHLEKRLRTLLEGADGV